MVCFSFAMFAIHQSIYIMAVEIITREDLSAFKAELLNDLANLLTDHSHKEKKWMRSGEVMKMLKISPGTLQNYRVNGTLSYTRFGNTYYYSHDEIQRLLEKGMERSSF